MYDFDKDVIDALIKNKPGKGNVDKVDKYDEKYVPDQIVMVVDRSGSMGSIKEDAEGGINGFIEENQKEGKALFTMVEFDTTYDVLCYKIPLEQIERYNLRPRGMTALLDAIGQAFAEVDEGSEADDHSKIGVIVTDGGENASKEWTHERVFARIDELKKKGWEFIFLAANQDAIETGSSYGFSADTTLNFDEKSAGSVYSAASAYTVSHRGGRGKSLGARRARASAVMDESVSMDEELFAINTHKSAQDVPSNVNTTDILGVDLNNVTITEDDINAVLNETERTIFRGSFGTNPETENEILRGSFGADPLAKTWTGDVVTNTPTAMDSTGFNTETMKGYIDELKDDLKKALAEEKK